MSAVDSSRTMAIAIFCTTLELGQEPLTKLNYWHAYQDLLLALKDRGIDAYFTTGNDSYLGDGQFKVAYTTDTKQPHPKHLKQVENVTVDMVFERSEGQPFAAKDILSINPDSIRRIANNKIAIYQYFSTLQPYSRIVDTRSELEEAVADMAGDWVVVKEPEGYGGDSVYIGPKADILGQLTADRYPLLVQEFHDTSMGAPGHAAGVHDLRVAISGGRITGCFLRMAADGALHSNVAQGGYKIYLAPNQVPREVVAAVREIDRTFAPEPRYYSADFAYSAQGWKLIELNDYVGLVPAGDGPEAAKSLDRLADYLVKVCATENRRRLARQAKQPARLMAQIPFDLVPR